MNNEILEVVKKHFEMYTLMQEEDLYKLVHQSFFGPAHYINDAAWANKYIKVEAESCQDKEPEIIYLGGGYYRYELVNNEEYLTTLCEAFIESANHITENKDGFRKILENVSKHLPNPEFKEKFEKLINEMDSFDYPAISHSYIYSQNYHPHYRVVHKKFINKIVLPNK